MWLKIVSDGPSLKVTWGNRHGAHPTFYHIGRESLQQAAADARAQLARLVEWSRTGNKVELPPILRAIAEAGSTLRFVLFDPLKQQRRQEIAELSDWIDIQREEGDNELTVSTDGSFHVPWPVLFEGTAPAGPDKYGIDAFAGFWGIKYDLTALFEGIVPEGAMSPRPRDHAALFSILNRHELDAGRKTLDDNERKCLDDLLDLYIPPKTPNRSRTVFTLDAARKVLSEISNRNLLLHFFGHGTENRLILDDEHHIDLNRYKLLLDLLSPRIGGRASRTYSLVFLNACETGFGVLDNNFFVGTAREGICGHIGCETKVPRHFASRFGLDFLTCLQNHGLSVREAMSYLRRKHWPMGLLYGCYSYLDWRIEHPSPPESAAAIDLVDLPARPPLT
jgi:hypothetical protein